MAEAEAEMCALESSIDTYSELSAMENPPDNLVSFANEVSLCNGDGMRRKRRRKRIKKKETKKKKKMKERKKERKEEERMNEREKKKRKRRRRGGGRG